MAEPIYTSDVEALEFVRYLHESYRYESLCERTRCRVEEELAALDRAIARLKAEESAHG